MYAAIAGFIGTVVIHTVASRFAPKVPFSWVDMLTVGRVSGAFLLRLRDVVVVILRATLVLLILLYPARPFLYRGRPPSEIWIKDVPSSTVKLIKERWGRFARLRFSPNPSPKGKVALVGSWEETPGTDYEVWSPSADWRIEDYWVSTNGLRLVILNPGDGRWFRISVISGGEVVLKDSLFVPSGKTGTYSATLTLSGPVKLEVGGRVLYDYVSPSKGEGKVVAGGLEREVWNSAIATLGLDVAVGVDTVLREEGSLNFLPDCHRLEEEGLRVRPTVVEFVFPDSGCAFLSGEPVLLDRRGQVVGVESNGRYYFGFYPTLTGWAFTPDFLKFLPLLSRSFFKVYTEVGDTVKLPGPMEIRGKTRMCCPETFVPKVAGVYELYRNGRPVGVVIANLRTTLSVPPPPRPLWPYILYAFLLVLSAEVLITFLPTFRR